MAAAVGVPDRVAVPLVPAVNTSPAGRAPRSATVAVEVPLVVTVKLKAAPVTAVARGRAPTAPHRRQFGRRPWYQAGAGDERAHAPTARRDVPGSGNTTGGRRDYSARLLGCERLSNRQPVAHEQGLAWLGTTVRRVDRFLATEAARSSCCNSPRPGPSTSTWTTTAGRRSRPSATGPSNARRSCMSTSCETCGPRYAGRPRSLQQSMGARSPLCTSKMKAPTTRSGGRSAHDRIRAMSARRVDA